METVKNYKCPCCGDGLEYKAGTSALHCSSCGNDFSLETLQQLEQADAASDEKSSAYNWEQYTPRSYEASETVRLSDYRCQSCGAEISGDDTLGASVCPYCGNPAIIKKQFEGSLKPDYIIPFKIDKKSAVSLFEKEYSSAPFIPDEFKDKKRVEEMSGVYVPFWTFDCDCHANITYSAKRTHFFSDARYNYVKTDHFRLFRSGNISFNRVPVDGLEKLDNAYTEAVEPYDYSEAVNFDTAYLSGFFADKYDVSAQESEKRANERIKRTAEQLLSQTVSGYEAVMPQSENISFSDGKIRYALMPVWLLNIKYMDKTYKFAVNGQTGKVAGEYPVDKKKRLKYFFKVFGISFAVIAAFLRILGTLGVGL